MIKSYKIPITVGVVGHLDVIVTERHRLQIIKFFRDLASEYPVSPISLFSSIAEGADRIVANIFLNLKNENEEYNDRFELIVPLPYNEDEYIKDFDDASKHEFEELLKQAKKSFWVKYEGDENDRPQHYLKAGKFVADSSIILLALWDGEKGKKGGTADVIRHKIAGDDENVAESTFEYDGTVFILHCNRTSTLAKFQNTEYGAEGLTLDMVLKDPAIKNVLEKIEEINSESVLIGQPVLEKSQSYLYNSPEKLDSPQNSILEWYSIFDVLSLGYRKRDITISIWLFVIGLLLIVTLEIYSNIFLTNLVLGIVMLFNVLATTIYFYSRIKKNHQKYLYNRTLAEALRIQFYWNIAGINKNVSDYILRIHKKDFTWVKQLLSAIYGISYNNRTMSSETIKDLNDNWVKNQADFFKSSISRMTQQLNFYHKISNTSFVLAFVLLVSIFFFGEYYKIHKLLNDLLVIIGTLLSLFALIKAYIQMKGYEQLLNQYELMNVIYQRAESKITETDTYELNPGQKTLYLKELFFVIGKEALIENGNWYLIFKEKEPEIEGI
jgi:hypothetical protein